MSEIGFVITDNKLMGDTGLRLLKLIIGKYMSLSQDFVNDFDWI